MDREEQILSILNGWQNAFDGGDEAATLHAICELFEFCRGHNIFHDGVCPNCERVSDGS